MSDQSATCRHRCRNRAHDGRRGRGPPQWTVGPEGDGEADPQAGQTHACDRSARRGGSAMVAGGIAFVHIRTNPLSCRLCSGPPAFAVNPRWGYARQKFRKIRFQFFACGQAKGLPAVFANRIFQNLCRVTAAGRSSPLAPSGMVPIQPKENYHGHHDRKPHHQG